MQTIQNALLDYSCNNKYLSSLLKASSAMAVIYPIYLIVSRISFHDFAWKYIRMISAIMYIAFYAFIAEICIVATKNSSQWAQFEVSTFNKAAQYVEVAGDALSGKDDDSVVCTNCGNSATRI